MRTSASSCCNQLESRGVKNLVFLTTDTHANFANVVRLRTLAGDSAPANAPADPTDTPYNDYITGPVATNTFWQRDRLDSQRAPAPASCSSNGVLQARRRRTASGMFCAQGDVYSYAEVEVSSGALTISYKDSAGQPARTSTATPAARTRCPPSSGSGHALVRLGAR